MKSNFKELFSNILVFAISSIGTKIVFFFLVPLYTHYLSSEELGTADLLTTTTGLVIPLITLSISESVYRFSMDGITDNREVLRCFYYVFTFSILISIICSFGLELVPELKEYKLLFVLVMLTSILNDGYSLFIKGNGRNKIFAFDNIVYVVSLAASNIIFLMIFEQGINGYLTAIVVSKIVSLLYLLILGKVDRIVNPFKVDHYLLKRMFRYSIPLLFNSINWWVVASSDKYMLNYLISASEVGLYTVASKVPALVNTATTVFTEAWTISSIKNYTKNSSSKFYDSVFEFFSTSMAILVSVVMLIARPFMRIYVPASYYPSIAFLPTLLMSAYYLGFASFIGVTFSTVMKSEVIMKSSLAAAGINIIINFLFIPRLGGLGAALATMFTYAVISLYRYFYAQKYMPLSFSKKQFLMTVSILTLQQIFVTRGKFWVIASLLCLLTLILLHIKTLSKMITTTKRIIMEKIEKK